MFPTSITTLAPLLILLISSSDAMANDHASLPLGLQETMTSGVTPYAKQREIVLAAARRVVGSKVSYDGDGNVSAIYLSNHAKDIPRNVADRETYLAARPGLDDATFVRLSGLTSLKQLFLLKQPLTDDAFSVLKNWPDLEVFCIENHLGDDSGRFMLQINGHPGLRWLELKHLFGLHGTAVDQLQAFPKLQRLELDNASATEKALPFLERNPQLRDFELHRTSMDSEQIGRLVEALPNLERLALKPGGRDCFDHRALAHVSRLKKLKVFGFHHWKEPMYVWDDGLEWLESMSALKYLECPKDQWELPAMKELRRRRPDIQHVQGKHLIVENLGGIDVP